MVNGNKVGKDNMWPNEHNAEIFFAGSNKKVFVFISIKATSDSFPPDLITKYTVSKVLGKGLQNYVLSFTGHSVQCDMTSSELPN